MAKSNKFFKRVFLNKDYHGTHAHVIGEIDNRNMKLQIADCQNKIYLHNHLTNGQEKSNAIFKLQTLRDTCDEMLQLLMSKEMKFTLSAAKERRSFLSFHEAETLILDEFQYVKTIAPDEVECFGFYEYNKSNSYAMIIENTKLKKKRFQLLFF